MRFVRSLFLLGLIIGATPALAFDAVESLTRLVREASTAPNPVMAFLQGANKLPNFTVGRAEIQRAMQAAGVPRTGPLRQLLGPTTRLAKNGNALSAQRSEETLVDLPEGRAVKLGRTIKANLSLRDGQAQVDRIEGIEVGENARSLYRLKRVRFSERGRGQNREQVAILTVGTFLGDIDRTISLGRVGPAPTARSGGGQPRARTGFTNEMERVNR